MKNLSICAIILSIVFACEDASEDNHPELSVLPALTSQDGHSYEESANAWVELKETNGDSYIYQTTITSMSGHGNTTEIRVDDGLVKTRIYQEFEIHQSNGGKKITFSYREDGGDLGSNPKGAEPLTIDELYQTCAANYLTADTETNTVYFQTSGEGMMTLCGFVPDGCMDDCYNGIRIVSFGWTD